MSNALNTQIDGDHYKKQKIQPLELAYLIGATPCFTKLAKYITRDKGDKLINLDKAIHCVSIEAEIKENACTHLLHRYPALHVPHMLDQADMLIDLFSEDANIRTALKCMMRQEYVWTIEAVEAIKESLNGVEQ